MKVITSMGRVIRWCLPFLPHKLAHSVLFYLNHRYWLDWNNPKTYDEKLTWSLANNFGREEAIYADKYRVREYVSRCGFENLLPEIYGIWNSADNIDLKKLPKKFVLKTNNGSGNDCIEICKDKTQMDISKIKKKFKRALNKNIWKNQCEYHYRYIEPLVFAEQLLDDNREERMTDYKIHCFNGTAVCILVCSNRANNLKLDYYDTDWNYLDVVPMEMRSGEVVPKPLGLPEMIRAAEVLSNPFPAARIDFYDVNGTVYFGEITLSPAGGNLVYINEKWQYKLGKLMSINKEGKSFTRINNCE